MVFDPKKQALHDKFAEIVVIRPKNSGVSDAIFPAKMHNNMLYVALSSFHEALHKHYLYKVSWQRNQLTHFIRLNAYTREASPLCPA
ncbi:hypothetical protein [Alteromonas hispanica]|uniref:Uncharacterized protein n=1 Tax=Alteromonas hispanica TaxID=315421 RepID=A0A6L9MQ60_9ALTE|nr:hypothetical protein [Alteromonas hispanica]NDW20369.1 hypothetical protein [Alteromonas hispanica]